MSAVLLDLDGTLIDSVPDLHQAAHALLLAHGRPTVDLEQVRAGVGHGARSLIRHLWSETGPPPDEPQLDLLYREFLVRYRPVATDRTEPYPGVPEALEQLARDHALVVVTNKPYAPARDILEHFGWMEWLAGLVGGDSCTTRKPHPEMLFEALGLADEERGVMVGDSDADMHAGRAAGMPTLGVSWGYASGYLEADAVIDQADQLPDAVRAALAGTPMDRR